MDLLNIFRQNIDLDTYKQMLREVFKADVLLDNSHIEQLPAITDDDKGYYIGNKRTSDRYNIGFFYYEIGRSNVARKKVGLRNLVHKFINSRDGQFDAALVAFKDANHWRLSFICDIQDEATAPKRFTFVFGDADSLYRTPIERFGKLQQKGLNKKNIQDAFSVEALNNQFFDDYKAHYEAFVEFITGKHFVKEGGKWVEKVIHDPHPTIYPQFKCDDKSVRDYVKQMMGRIVFLHFLQKKGWMGVPADAETWEGGDQNFMFKLFQYATPAQKSDFLDTVLEPLFFECLNTERERDIYVTPVEAIGKVRIPYLNGELFEKTKLDETECKFDVKLFENLFNLFNSYNFTIDENDPSDAEIGVDPEMLGKIFENLLEDNKDKGAFYTPKEIVSYMCKESLIAYLQSKFGKAHHDSIRTLVNTHLKDQHLEEDQNVCERLNKALRDVKVCDPAIGSGAFPMGLLNEIFTCRCQLETTDKPKSELKGEIIQNNIYGVDIERGAVDIARLRFWLALIVDAEKPVPLPNLDYKIMQGNSLLESYKGLDLSNLMQSDDMFVQMKAEEVEKDIKAYFKAKSNTDKKNLREQINFDIVQCLRFAGFQDDIEIPNTDFFLWHTYFRDVFSAKEEKDRGFDIVIGNPPYNELRDLSQEEQEAYKKSKYHKYAEGGRVNMFQYFYPLGIDICNQDGIICLITQNSLLAEDSAIENRKLIFANTTILSVDSYPERDDKNKRVFESAKMSVCFCVLRNNTTSQMTPFNITIWEERQMQHFRKLIITAKEIKDVFKNDLTIPICDQIQLNILVKMRNKSDHSVYNINAGEIDMTKYKNYFSYDPSSDKTRIVTGAQVLRYYITDNPSQGGVKYVPTSCLSFSNSRFLEVNAPRLVMQRITGVDSKIRLIATLLPKGMCCANSTNYISSLKNSLPLSVLLAILNSTAANYIFKATSTNTNVTSKEISKIPIPVMSNRDKKNLSNKVDRILADKKANPLADTTAEEHEIDRLVYELYGLTNGEVKIIDPNETTVGSDDDLFKA